jgi:hypothetical protein
MLEVVLEGHSFFVEALPSETMADVRAAILRELGRTDEEARRAQWPMTNGSGVQVVGNTPVDRCPQWMGFKFHLTRPTEKSGTAAGAR